APGETKTGEVTIRNAGDTAGAVTLSTARASDAGAPAGRPLSGLLDLSVLDVSDTTPVTVFSGKLGALSRVALGTFAPGAAHRYRFALTYPGKRPARVPTASRSRTRATAPRSSTTSTRARRPRCSSTGTRSPWAAPRRRRRRL